MRDTLDIQSRGLARVANYLTAPVGAEYDTPAGGPAASSLRCYIVCSTPRSGSSLLCRALASMGIAGTPTEYFNPVTRASLTARSRRTSANGVFGTKLHWEQLEQLRAESLGLGRAEPEFEISASFLEQLLPAPVYIHILRRDVNRQAV